MLLGFRVLLIALDPKDYSFFAVHYCILSPWALPFFRSVLWEVADGTVQNDVIFYERGWFYCLVRAVAYKKLQSS